MKSERQASSQHTEHSGGYGKKVRAESTTGRNHRPLTGSDFCFYKMMLVAMRTAAYGPGQKRRDKVGSPREAGATLEHLQGDAGI